MCLWLAQNQQHSTALMILILITFQMVRVNYLAQKRQEWSVKDDHFTVYFESAHKLLDYFQSDLQATGTEAAVSEQHRN